MQLRRSYVKLCNSWTINSWTVHPVVYFESRFLSLVPLEVLQIRVLLGGGWHWMGWDGTDGTRWHRWHSVAQMGWSGTNGMEWQRWHWVARSESSKGVVKQGQPLHEDTKLKALGTTQFKAFAMQSIATSELLLSHPALGRLTPSQLALPTPFEDSERATQN